jgi:hypothetical protein
MSNHAKAWINEKTGDIHSPKGRLVWPHLLEARANPKIVGSKKKFNAVLLIPAGADITVISNEIKAKAEAEFGKDWAKKKLRFPLVKTADEPKLAEYADKFPYVLKPSANEEFPPFVYSPNAQRYQGDGSDIYSGRWAIVAGTAWTYTTGSNGIGWNLNRVQLLDHDETIAGGRVDTSEGFEAVDVPTGGSTDDVFGGGKPATPDSKNALFNDDLPI